MSEKMNYALTVAGFDGSACAGILADVKTMAHFGVYAQAVCTALTEQNEDEFVAPGWVIWERIEAQLETLFKKHTFKFVKIGLREAMPLVKKLYVTRVLSDVDGDVFFPDWGDGWRMVSEESFSADEKNDFATLFQVWER